MPDTAVPQPGFQFSANSRIAAFML